MGRHEQRFKPTLYFRNNQTLSFRFLTAYSLTKHDSNEIVRTQELQNLIYEIISC